MRQGIRILGTILLAAAVCSPAWAKPGKGKGGGSGSGGGESQAGGLPALEDRVDAIDIEIATLTTEVGTLTTEVNNLITEVGTLTTTVGTLQTDVTDLRGQNNFAVVDETATTCTLATSSSSAGPVSATFISNGVCQITFSKSVASCSSVASIAGTVGGEIAVISATKTIAGDSVNVSTFVPAATPAFADFNLTVTCP